MSEVIYILTIVYTFYVIYVAEGDRIVAFIKDVFGMDLSYPHECCSQALNRIRNLISFKAPVKS